MADDATWHILASTMLRAVSYDSRSGQLRVRFATGAIYVYLDVPRGVVDALLDPTIGSPGRYFNEHIRDEFDCDEER